MTLERTIANAFALDDAAWRRHANPWSVALRNTALPLLVLAFWSRVWPGWLTVVPIILMFLWTWLNSRIFPVPASLHHWASKAVFGEWIWLNRDAVPEPVHHRIIPNILSVVSGIGMLFVVWGVLVFEQWPTRFGMAPVYCCKLWFLDRMVWLHEDGKSQ